MKFFFKTYKTFLLISLTCCMLFSCEWQDKSVPVDKTVLIYIAANNDLSQSAKTSLDTLKYGYIPDYFERGGTGGVLLVYYHNPEDRLSNNSKRPPRLLRISKDEYGTVSEEILQEYGHEQNSGDVATLKEVIDYANGLFPSDDKGLFLWSHGTGWVVPGFGQRRLSHVEDPAAHLVKNFGTDRGTEMEIKDLAAVLPKYSFIVFDACFMGGVEVVYQLKDKADYIISSSAEVLLTSFPYHKIMTHIYENEEPNLINVCKEYVNFYSTQPLQHKRSATVSLVETSRLKELADASQVIFNKNRENVDTLDLKRIQGYFRGGGDWYYDLDDYMRNISSDNNDYRRFASAMESAVIYKDSTPHFFWDGNSNAYNGFLITHFHGLSTYIPKPANTLMERYYKTLSWNIDAQMIK